MVSSYLPELFGICDRLAVMTRGVLSEAQAAGGVDRAVADGGCDRGLIAFVSCPTILGGNRSWTRASRRVTSVGVEKGAAALRGTLGWVWTVFGPFLGLVLVTLLFAFLTRDSGSFLSVLQLADDRRADGDRRDRRAGDDDHHHLRGDRPLGRLDRGSRDGGHRASGPRPGLAAGAGDGRGGRSGWAVRVVQRQPDQRAGRRPLHHHPGESEDLPRTGQVALDEHRGLYTRGGEAVVVRADPGDRAAAVAGCCWRRASGSSWC